MSRYVLRDMRYASYAVRFTVFLDRRSLRRCALHFLGLLAKPNTNPVSSIMILRRPRPPVSSNPTHHHLRLNNQLLPPHSAHALTRMSRPPAPHTPTSVHSPVSPLLTLHPRQYPIPLIQFLLPLLLYLLRHLHLPLPNSRIFVLESQQDGRGTSVIGFLGEAPA